MEFGVTVGDYTVSVGSGLANVVQLTNTLLTVQPPRIQPSRDSFTAASCGSNGSLAMVVRSLFAPTPRVDYRLVW